MLLPLVLEPLMSMLLPIILQSHMLKLLVLLLVLSLLLMLLMLLFIPASAAIHFVVDDVFATVETKERSMLPVRPIATHLP
jgi:hypothetical protein